MNTIIYLTEISESYKKRNMEHMIGERLLELGLEREFGRKLAFEPRSKGEYGKPFFTLLPEVYYNISHSGKYVACAFAEAQVGLDIQKHREVSYEKMLSRMVTEKRRQEILAAENVQEVFFREWVYLESFIKWTGEGLSRDLRSISRTEGWHCFLELDEGYSAAVCMAEPHEVCIKKVEIELP